MVHRLIRSTQAQTPGPSGPGVRRADVFAFGPPPPGRVRLAARTVLAGVSVLLVLVVGLGLVVGPRIVGYRVLYVRTASMVPTLPVGSLVVVRSVHADDISTGDILTFSHPDDPRRLVTHRVVGREGDTFVTQGDASAAPDPWRVSAQGSGWRHAFSLPNVGFLLAYLHSGALSTVVLAAVILFAAAQALHAMWRPRRSFA